jgi:hypothetical protein
LSVRAVERHLLNVYAKLRRSDKAARCGVLGRARPAERCASKLVSSRGRCWR